MVGLVFVVAGLATGLAVVGLDAAELNPPLPNPHGGVLVVFAVLGRNSTGCTFVSYTFFLRSTKLCCSAIRRRMFATCFA